MDTGFTEDVGKALDGQTAFQPTGFDDCLPGADFIPHQTHTLSRRSDKGNATVLANFSEFGIFRKEPVTGMNGIGIGDFSSTDNRFDIQITA